MKCRLDLAVAQDIAPRFFIYFFLLFFFLKHSFLNISVWHSTLKSPLNLHGMTPLTVSLTKVWFTASIIITHIENWTGPTGEQKRGSLKGSSTHKTLPFVHRFMWFTQRSRRRWILQNSVTPSQFLCIRFGGGTGYLQKVVVNVPLETVGDSSWGEVSNRLTRLHSLCLYCTLMKVKRQQTKKYKTAAHSYPL